MRILAAFSRPRAWCAATFLLTALTAAAQAETIPDEYLAVDRKTCNQACTEKGAAADWCQRNCDCSLDKVKAQVTLEEYMAVSQAMAQNQDPPAASIAKLTDIAKSCAQETK